MQDKGRQENTLPETVLVVEEPTGHTPAARRARDLAAEHSEVLRPWEKQGIQSLAGLGSTLTSSLDEYQRLVRDAVRYFRGASEQEIGLSYAAEWMMDNYYIVLQVLRQIGEDLPARYYWELPELKSGPYKGYPRVFAAAREYIRQAQVLVDLEQISSFLQEYQTVTPLTLGELWAFPNMLRLSIVQAVAASLIQITGLKSSISKNQSAVLQLDGQVSDDEVIANSILSLRVLGTVDWKDFVEQQSQVELALSRDPARVYPLMEFETRDRYRKQVEKVARAARKDEQEVARLVVLLAERKAFQTGAGREAHVGYYLIDQGRREVEVALNYRLPFIKRLKRWVFEHPTLVYLGSISILSLSLLSFLLFYVDQAGGSILQIAFVAVLGLVLVATVAVDMVNSIVTHSIKPSVLPKLDFSEGIPPQHATLVVVPALFSSPGEVQALLRQLEQHYLRNMDPYLFFAVVSDYADAPEKEMPGDEELLEMAVQGVNALNQRYPREHAPAFYLFHRERQWNPQEGVWMGWERKRGKIHELNCMILGEQETSFNVKVGELSFLSQFQYVITLDEDTIITRQSAHRMVGAMAHPLNRPEFDAKGRVKSGYTILQPRTEIDPTSANRSLFSRIYSGNTGLDLYTLAVSDVYQDLFGEGIYVGKGIYDVQAFERSLEGRVPENTLLSHDLFEGIHGRAGLVTDVVLIEDFPPHYLAHTNRIERWIRGDWQILPWLFPQVSAGESEVGREVPGGRTSPNPLSLIDRWKILDNLRRSLVSPALLLLFVLGWTWLPGSPLVWTLVGLLVLAVPLVSTTADSIGTALSNPASGNHRAVNVIRPVGSFMLRWLFSFVFLPFESLLVSNAILTTLWRVFVSRKDLLQWTTSAQAARLTASGSIDKGIRQAMAYSLVLSGLAALLVWIVNPPAMAAAFPILLLWMLAYPIAVQISLPIEKQPVHLTAEEQARLRTLARHTWLFFEQFIGPEDHWLPPDHYQEIPRGVVAHRTSPTNIGAGMLSILGAYDLGYIGLLDLAARLRSMFETLDRLEKYRGHFLNWYDTRSLEPLQPRYVSSVDSGNLAASMLALGEGCRALVNAPVSRWETWQGLLDSLDLILQPVVTNEEPEIKPYVEALREQVEAIQQRVIAVKASPEKWDELAVEFLDGLWWGELDRRLLSLVENAAHLLEPVNLQQLGLYSRSLRSQIDALRREIDLLSPWVYALEQAPALFREVNGNTELQQKFARFCEIASRRPQLQEVAGIAREGQAVLEALASDLSDFDGGSEGVKEAREWCSSLAEKLESAWMTSRILQIGFEDFHSQCQALTWGMDFSFLFNAQRQVFHIGYNVELGRLDNNFYDLLASEARTASIIAIAKGDAPYAHWLHLSRPFTHVNGVLTLLSWSATMFEYLMPLLFLRSYEGTLLHQSMVSAVDHQIEYGRQKKVPWGISESGYYHFDAHQNYQYRAFGVPGLGYKRGLQDDLVIAPYASLLALPLRPRQVLENIQHMQKLDLHGTYGLFEAADFTPERLALGDDYRIVRSYMAHHQGMILLSLVNYLKDNIIVERFHSEPHIHSVDLLLQEQTPANAPLETLQSEEGPAIRPEQKAVKAVPWGVSSRAPQPRVHYLSNGRFSTLITSTGSGYSTWNDVDLTRWRADTTLDSWGQWLYVQDLDSGEVWSAGELPVGGSSSSSEVFFNAHLVNFRRREKDVSLNLIVTVSPDEDLEIRKVTLTNHGESVKRIRLVSYGEVVLNQQAADERHPAFNKLFIQSEVHAEGHALVFRRRQRSRDEEPVFLVHAIIKDHRLATKPEYETSRERFIGRGRTFRRPAVLDPANLDESRAVLPGTTGATLDPIFSLGLVLELAPRSTSEVAFLTLAGSSWRDLLDVVERYKSKPLLDRVVAHVRSQAEAELQQLGITTGNLSRYQQLLSVLLYPHPVLRAPAERLDKNTRGQPGLWAYGLSGDYPILLVRVYEPEDLNLIQELLRAHAYWRSRLLKIDLVIVNEKGTDYGQELNSLLHRLLVRMKSDVWLNRHGGIYLLLADRLGEEGRILLDAAARAVLDGKAGTLDDQLRKMHQESVGLPRFVPVIPEDLPSEPTAGLERPTGLLFDNGWGGFASNGCEYILYLDRENPTPAPWSNVIANPDFGFLVTEMGSSFTWAINSGENRLTPWSNDPVSDVSGEALYIRDEETGRVWSPTPLPAGDDLPYLVRHGAGYTIFEHHSQGLKQQVRLFTAQDAPVKIIQLRLENSWDRSRRLTATYYIEWVLGVSRYATQQYIIPEYEVENQTLLARNPYYEEFSGRAAFAAVSKTLHGLTASREEFLGRGGDLSNPLGLQVIGLSGMVAPGLDPCAALQVHIELAPGEGEVVTFLLGQGEDRETSLEIVRRFKEPAQVEEAWIKNNQFWDDLLGTVQVKTPEPGMDLLLNRWMLYQALSCRIWGRSGFYQSSGAYGFRDQLQDIMSLVHSAPHIAREHILRAAAHQFEAGDVLHWWHPPSGRGVRTRYSDDLLWLPYAAAYYVHATGDESVLDEEVPFLTGPALEAGEKERYGLYEATRTSYPVFDHCRRALERGTTSGAHNLPLMGSGDWNDGMNRVGIEGRGESVWLGWFLYDVLVRFADLCERRGEPAQGAVYRERASVLSRAIEESAWDGDWYLRAFYDDGSPLGSSQNKECQIDSIAQSWAVISEAGRPEMAERAMQSVSEHLVKPEERLLLLFKPPFDKTPRDPGYIKGYLPGIRENGGQYTHAAIWTVWAFALQGRGDYAGELFNLLNPIYHTDSPEKVRRYRVEPYVIAADVYSIAPHTGRGGWTWYTGSSGWMYRLGVEAILGLRLEGDTLRIEPCIPQGWEQFEIVYNRNGTVYNIHVDNKSGTNHGVEQVLMDGEVLEDRRIPLLEGSGVHAVHVRMGPGKVHDK